MAMPNRNMAYKTAFHKSYEYDASHDAFTLWYAAKNSEHATPSRPTHWAAVTVLEAPGACALAVCWQQIAIDPAISTTTTISIDADRCAWVR